MSKDFASVLKVAREHAILGMYAEALSKYQLTLDTIDNFLSSGRAGSLSANWQKARQDICAEVTAVQGIVQLVSKFRIEGASKPPKRIHEEKPVRPVERQQDVEAWPPPPPKVVYKPKPQVQVQVKLVQAPQPPAKKPAVAAPQPVPAKPAKPKPAKAVAGKQAPGKAVKGKVEEEKVSFLKHKFPEGSGPDAELIQMLEHDVLDTNPGITFDEIAELGEAKQLLEEAVLLPILMPEFFQGIRKPWKGVLLFGPPGTGKTMLAKAVATLGKTTFFNVSAATLASRWHGESEKLVRLLFEMARFYAPTTLFFDEIDGLGSKRGEASEHEASRRVKTELLTQIDGVVTEEGKHIVLLAATNRPWDLDEALRRRLEKRIYIPLPSTLGRRELFNIYLRGIELQGGIEWEELLSGTEGYSGSDIASVCRDAAMMPLRKKMVELRERGVGLSELEEMKGEIHVPISMADLQEALSNVSRSVGTEDLQRYVDWMAKYGNSV